MRVTLVQTALYWENRQLNRQMLSEKLSALAGLTDLVVLPEMFTTGFTMNAAALAEPMDGETFHWMQRTAAELKAAVTGSFICSEGAHFFNRLLFMFPDGSFEQYDKKHLFGLAAEHETYTAGNAHLTVNWKGWRIKPLICYDLRFPAWSRNASPTEQYDLLLYVANWPERRAHHWKTLLMARAIENQAWVAGVNVIGSDGNALHYQGDSALIDYAGKIQLEFEPGQEGMATGFLNKIELDHYRKTLPFLRDADRFSFI